MDEIKELERRIRIALDRISEGIESERHNSNKNFDVSAIQAEIDTLTEQNAKLSTMLANLEKKRSSETEEMQRLYNKLASVLKAPGQLLEQEKG